MDEANQSKQGTKTSIGTPPELQRPLREAAMSEPQPEIKSGLEKHSPSPTPEPRVLPNDYQTKFAEEIHNYIREYIRNADQKATFFFAAATALLAFLHSQHGTARWLKHVQQWSVVDGLAFVSMCSLAASASILLTVVFPRLNGSRRGFLFFAAIAEHNSAQDFSEEILRRSTADLTSIKLHHSFDLSKICVAKYRVLVLGFRIGGVGAITALLYLLLAGTS